MLHRIIQQIKNRCILLIGIALLCGAGPAVANDTHTTQHKAPAHTSSKNHKHKSIHSKKKTKVARKSHRKHLAKNKRPKHHAQFHSGTNSDDVSLTGVSSRPINHDLATINLNNMTPSHSSLNQMFSVKKNIVAFVQKTVETLHYSSYKLGGSKFDTERGVYVVDCSNFVDRILATVYPNAYSSLVNSTGADNPVTRNYFSFFRDLDDESDGYWNKINGVEELQAGDVLVFRYKNSRGNETGGHVMVVMDKPVHVSDFYFVRIADSAESGHSEDTRHRNESGIGIGTLLLKTNPKTGEPSAFAWGVNSSWNRKVKIAMARPKEMGSSIG